MSANTNTDDVGGREVELLGEFGELGVLHGLGEEVDSHRGDELLVTNSGAVLEKDAVTISIDLVDCAMLAKASVLFLDGVRDSNPDATSTASSWEAEGGIRTPVTGGLVENDVGGDHL